MTRKQMVKEIVDARIQKEKGIDPVEVITKQEIP
jgi:hypothetical protein